MHLRTWLDIVYILLLMSRSFFPGQVVVEAMMERAGERCAGHTRACLPARVTGLYFPLFDSFPGAVEGDSGRGGKGSSVQVDGRRHRALTALPIELYVPPALAPHRVSCVRCHGSPQVGDPAGIGESCGVRGRRDDSDGDEHSRSSSWWQSSSGWKVVVSAGKAALLATTRRTSKYTRACPDPVVG